MHAHIYIGTTEAVIVSKIDTENLRPKKKCRRYAFTSCY